jgi:hypothetical protein
MVTKMVTDTPTQAMLAWDQRGWKRRFYRMKYDQAVRAGTGALKPHFHSIQVFATKLDAWTH